MSRIAISDGSTWPRPAMEADENYGVGNRLRYARDLTQAERMEAASIIDAYGYLTVESTGKKLALVVREIRAALKRESQDSES